MISDICRQYNKVSLFVDFRLSKGSRGWISINGMEPGANCGSRLISQPGCKVYKHGKGVKMRFESI